jgi:hypothetical protein
MREIRSKPRKSPNRGLTGVKSLRANGVKKRELTQLQRRAIRILIAEPGITYKSVADRIHVDRSAVSRWANHDELFIAELEAAQAAPRERLSAEDALDRLAPGEEEKLTELLVEGGRVRTPSWLRELKELIDSPLNPCDERDIIYALFDVLRDTMVKWRHAKSSSAPDVCRGILGMRKELNGLLLSVGRHDDYGSEDMEPDDPYLLAERQAIKEELAIIDRIESDTMQDEESVK